MFTDNQPICDAGYFNSLYENAENPLVLQAEGGSLVPLINVSLPTVWERGQV